MGEPPKLDILDVGCGVGITAEYLAGEFKSVYGVDVSKESIAAAKERHSAATYQVYDGEVLPFSDGSFDLSFAIGVLHHVPSSARSQLLSEMRRATRPGGLVVVFEHNPFNPLTRLAVRRCDFDKDCVLVSKKVTSRLFRQNDLSPAEESYILFLPWSIPWTARLEAVIRNVPLGAQYLVAARRAG